MSKNNNLYKGMKDLGIAGFGVSLNYAIKDIFKRSTCVSKIDLVIYINFEEVE